MNIQESKNIDIFENLEKIDNIEVLRHLMNYYQNEHSNFISDFNNVNSKIAGIYNLAAVFLGYFFTLVIFLFTSSYILFDTCIKAILFEVVVIFMMLLLIFIAYVFGLQKFQKGYMKMNVDFPIKDAYTKSSFWAQNNEKEFLCQMIYNLHKNNEINNKKLNKLTETLPSLHIDFIFIISVIIVSIVGIIITGK